MSYIKVGQENSGTIELYYEDHEQDCRFPAIPVLYSSVGLHCLASTVTRSGSVLRPATNWCAK